MRHLLCRIGIHVATWQPVNPAHHDGWLHVRTCTHCSYPIVTPPRNHH